VPPKPDAIPPSVRRSEPRAQSLIIGDIGSASRVGVWSGHNHTALVRTSSGSGRTRTSTTRVTREQEQQATTLMVRAQAGDRQAYEDLLRLLTVAARGFVRRRAGWAEWTEDVVQETLLTVHRARQTYDQTRPFAPWFFAILNSRLLDALRDHRRVRTRELIDDEAVGRQPASEPDGLSDSVRETLARAVARLPRVQREVVSLLKYEDMSVREVATRLGMSEGAVKVTAHRSYKVLRRTVGASIGEYRATN
jgi:RNA polymerase sigma-70 factor, ECF subfamily